MATLTQRRLPGMAEGIDVLRMGEARVFRIPDGDVVAWPAAALFDAAPERLAGLEAQAGEGAPRVALGFNVYLVETPGGAALIDAGIGNGKDRPDRPAWHARDAPFLERLAALGFPPERIDVLVLTHLHADHVGWVTVRAGAGWRPTFPRAQAYVARRELAHWQALHAASPAAPILHGAFADSVAPLLAAGRLAAVDLPFAALPGLTMVAAPGHSPGMAAVRLEAGGEPLLFAADVLHHRAQVGDPSLGSRFCHDRVQAEATRRALLQASARDGTLLAASHFPAPAFGRIRAGAEGFRYVPLPAGRSKEPR